LLTSPERLDGAATDFVLSSMDWDFDPAGQFLAVTSE
jgi:hypothetical protein